MEPHGLNYSEHLQALTYDQLAVANWQRANAGKKVPAKPPKPVSPLLTEAMAKKNHYGKTDKSPEEIKTKLASLGFHM